MTPLNTDDIEIGKLALFAMFKGEPKTGKSVAAHSFPDPYTLLFDVGRMPSIIRYYKKNFKYNTFPDLISVNQQLDALKEHCPYKTIIFDGITNYGVLAEQCMIDHRNPYQKIDSKTVRAGIAMTEIEDYGGVYRALVQVINSLLSIHIKHNVHVIVIAHVIEVETKDIKTKMTSTQRSVLTAGKKAAAVLPTNFNEMYHFYVVPSMDPNDMQPQFVSWTVSNGRDTAASAVGLPPQITWTNGNFYEKVHAAMIGQDLWR